MSGAPTRDLAALLSSRIAHDLISPLSAVGNGVELLELTGGAGSAERALVRDSLARTEAQLRLCRLAFGLARPGQSLAPSELAGLFPGPRFAVDWQIGTEPERARVKLALLLILCCDSAMPRGGRAAVAGGPAGWRIVAEAERLEVEPGLWGLIETPEVPDGLTPATVHFALAGIEAAAQRRLITVSFSETSIRITF